MIVVPNNKMCWVCIYLAGDTMKCIDPEISHASKSYIVYRSGEVTQHV